MIKVGSIDKVEYYGTETRMRVSLLADNKDEVIAIGTDGSTVDGLEDDDILASFSTAFTSNMELGILNSEGEWKF